MNTVSIENPAQRLYIPNLIAEFSGYQVAGCLQIYVGSDFWLIYLDQGKLIFASNSVEPFGRLNRHLRRLSIQTPSLVSAVVQVRLLFERSGDRQMYSSQDYQAICWLVEQQYLTPAQATLLIEELAKEVLESLLSVQAEYYRFQEQECFNQFLKFCQLDPQALIKYCQAKPQSDQTLQTSKQVAPVVDSKLSRQMDTSFLTELARQLSTVNADSSQTSSSRLGEFSPSPNRNSYTIACIDDSPVVLKTINSFLDDKTFRTILISDPVRALMQVIRSKPNLVLLDVTMPNLDGYELCSLLRRHPNFRNMPVVMITSHAGLIDRARAKLAGATGYLVKPFTQSDLVKLVFRHLT